MTGAAKAIAARFVEAYNAADWIELADLLSEDFRWIVPVLGTVQSDLIRSSGIQPVQPADRDKAATLAIFAASVLQCRDGRFILKILRSLEDGDTAVLQLEGHVETLSGRTYNNQYCQIFDTRDGQISRLTEYQDTFLAFDVWLAP